MVDRYSFSSLSTPYVANSSFLTHNPSRNSGTFALSWHLDSMNWVRSVKIGLYRVEGVC
jgi:hypothetical protein